MRGQLVHALLKAAEVGRQLAQVILDHMHLLARGVVLEHRARGGQHRHQGGGRDHPYPRPLRLFHQVREVRVDLGEDRLGRDEHHRAVRGLPRNQVLGRDVADVLADIPLELGRRGEPLRLAQVEVLHPLVALQRELGVDGHVAGGIGQAQQAVDPLAVTQGGLQFEAALGHHVAHQSRQLHLAEGPARALVGEHLLQADHVAGELGDLLLRLVDAAQVLQHPGEGLGGLFEAVRQAFLDLAADLLQALVGDPGQPLHALAEFLRGQAEGILDLLAHGIQGGGEGLLLPADGLALHRLEGIAVARLALLHLLAQVRLGALLRQARVRQLLAHRLVLPLEALHQVQAQPPHVLQHRRLDRAHPLGEQRLGGLQMLLPDRIQGLQLAPLELAQRLDPLVLAGRLPAQLARQPFALQACLAGQRPQQRARQQQGQQRQAGDENAGIGQKDQVQLVCEISHAQGARIQAAWTLQ